MHGSPLVALVTLCACPSVLQACCCQGTDALLLDVLASTDLCGLLQTVQTSSKLQNLLIAKFRLLSQPQKSKELWETQSHFLPWLQLKARLGAKKCSKLWENIQLKTHYFIMRNRKLMNSAFWLQRSTRRRFTGSYLTTLSHCDYSVECSSP